MSRAPFPGAPGPAQITEGLENFRAPPKGTVLTIGNFDGVHLGHQALIRRAAEIARASGTIAVAATFEPHPSAVLVPGRPQERLTTREEKLSLLLGRGADRALVLRSTPALFQTPALEFLDKVTAQCRPVAFVEGSSFMFGRGREGSVQTLRECSKRLGYSVEVLDSVILDDAGQRVPISSSSIRAAIRRGQVEPAARMLGRPHAVSGVVQAGARRGRGLGFPTANLTGILQVLPGYGVYAGWAELLDSQSGVPSAAVSRYAAAINVGPQPTFGDATLRVEAHLIGFGGDLVARPLRLLFHSRLRDQRKFASTEDLRSQLAADVHAAQDCLHP